MEKETLGIRAVGFDARAEALQVQSDLNGGGTPYAVNGVMENMRGFETELLEDRPVTFYTTFVAPYGGRLRIGKSPFIHTESALIASQIDSAEGDGLVLSSWCALEKSLVERFHRGEHTVYAWISPRGRAATYGKYAGTFYPYNQVFVGALGSNGEVRNWALKMDIPESILADWVNTISGSDLITDSRRGTFLTHPLVVGLEEGVCTPHQLLDVLRGVLESYSLTTVYTTREKVRFSVDDLQAMMIAEKRPSQLVQTAAAMLEERLRTAQGTLSHEYLRDTLQAAYFSLLERYAENGVVTISGCVGTVDLRRFTGGIAMYQSPRELVREFQQLPIATTMRIADALMPALEPFVCPKCQVTSHVPVGKQCPNPACGITFEQWQREAVARGIAACD